MAPPKPNSVVASLPPTIPFLAPEVLERRSGRPIKLRLGANESVYGMSPRARQAVLETIDRIAWYPDPENFVLRKRLADLLHAGMENIVIGCGVDDLLGLIVRVFLEPGGKAVASLGSYPTFRYHVEGYGGQMSSVPYREAWNDLDALAETATRVNAQIVYLANPDNPTGTFYPAAELQRFLEKIPAECLVLLDEAYAEYAPQQELLPLDANAPGLIRLRTFSKAYGMAGARIGYGIASPEKIQAFDKVRLHFGVSKFAQEAAAASLDDPEFLAYVARAVAEGREDYYKLAQELGLRFVPSSTNFVLIDMRTPEQARFLLNRLLEEGIFIRMPNAPPLDRYVRITTGTPEDRSEFAEAMRRLVRSGAISVKEPCAAVKP